MGQVPGNVKRHCMLSSGKECRDLKRLYLTSNAEEMRCEECERVTVRGNRVEGSLGEGEWWCGGWEEREKERGSE